MSESYDLRIFSFILYNQSSGGNTTVVKFHRQVPSTSKQKNVNFIELSNGMTVTKVQKKYALEWKNTVK